MFENLFLQWHRRSGPAIVAFFGAFLSAQCSGQGVINITFDGPPVQAPGTGRMTTNYAERGTSFVGFFARYGSGFTRHPNNGTAYITASGIFLPDGPPATCARLDGLTFRVLSADLAGYSDVVPSGTAKFEGHRSDGSVVATNFPVDGLVFQTYHFAPDFTDLTNLWIAADSLDNLRLEVPTMQPVLGISAYPYFGSGWIRVSARGTLGLPYRLEYTSAYPAANWITLKEFESSFWSYEYVPTNTPPQRFFRVVELP
jgi:hypothetical protein